MEMVGYLSAILMGVVLGMIGGGGSILTVPILVYLFHIQPVLATAYSLFIVGVTALVGGLFSLKKREVDLKTGFLFAVPSFIGVYVTRAYVLPNLSDPVFFLGAMSVSKSLFIMAVFSVLMVFASISMIRQKKTEIRSQRLSQNQKTILIGIEGLIVGMITGFVGAGGGFLIIPALVILIGLSMKIAVGTSLFIIAAKSLIGFIGDVQTQTNMDWRLLLSISALAIFGLILGASFSKNIPEKTLKKSFGYFVLVMGVFILIDQAKRM